MERGPRRRSRSHEPAGTDEQNRWHARPVLAALLKIVVVAVPVLCSLAAAWIASALLPHPASSARWFYRGLTVVIGLAAAVLAERGARRLLPMTALLKLSLLFPDQAPSRFKVARKAHATARLGQLAQQNDGSAVNLAADILALLAALTSHDKRTRGHAERVRVYTDLLAEQLRLSRYEQDRLRWAALLHDIGKLSVDPEILNKPGKPSEREWAILRAHPEQGAKAAASLLSWLGESGRAIIEHHEKFDGTGYPEGLAGTKISQAGRLIGVVDAFEVMTAARSYKRPMSTLKAREELANCAGAHFDPIMVRAFLAISLPRLLWATGPLSFIVQLPVIGAARDVGTTVLAAGPSVVAAAAAGAVVVSGASGGAVTAGPAPQPRSIAGTLATKAPQDSGKQQLSPADKGSGVLAHRSPGPTFSALPPAAVSPSTAPAPQPIVQPIVQPITTVYPTPTPSPTPAPTPNPTPTPTPSPIAPSLLLTSGPAASTTSTTAVVSFSVDDPAATVTCSLDSGPAAPCSGSWSASGLAVGPHVLTVVATNAGGTSTQTYGWTVTAPIPPAPTVTLISGPTSSTTATNATVAFSVSDPGASVTCSLDSGSASACSGSWSVSGLAVGPHVLTVAATNAGGTTSQTYSWTVTAPIPPAPTVTVTGGPGPTTTSTAAMVSFSVDDPAATVTCSLDGGSASVCASAWTAAGLAIGSHVLTIAATNAGGTTTQTYSWTINAVTPPPVSIDSGPADGSSVVGPVVTFAFSSTAAGATFQCSLDGAAFTACSSTMFYVMVFSSHTFQVRAVVAGVAGPIASRTFLVIF